MQARLRTGVVLLTLALARAEHGDTLRHTHDGPYNSLHRRDSAVRVRQIRCHYRSRHLCTRAKATVLSR